MWANLAKHWFLTALAVCFTGGYLGAEPLKPLLEMSLLRGGIVFVVMWVMGVTLHAEMIRKSLAKPFPSLLAIAINMAIVPLLCLPTMWLLPERLFGGLFVTAIVPCTLASASVWTRKAGGDDSIAMMTTVVTNFACVLVVPLGIWLVLAEQAEIDAAAQVTKLAIIVVAPLILAQVMRRAGADRWADRHRVKLAVLGQIGILAMVVFGAAASRTIVGAGEDGAAAATSWFSAITVLGTVVILHVVVLCLGIMAAKSFQMARVSQIAVGFAGSQKTLMVGLQIAIDCGVSVVPMIVYHLCQLVIDTIVAQRWKKKSIESEVCE